MWKWMMKIYETDFDGLALARLYLDATGGRFLPGLIHNANNSCHIIALATELLRAGPGQNLDTKLDKITGAENGLQTVFNTAVSRSQLMDSTPAEVHLPDFVQSELDFFHNCLFFKHHIQAQVTVAPHLKPVTLPPVAFLYCLEAAIVNAVEACQPAELPGSLMLGVDIGQEGDGVRVSVTSPTTLPAEIDPFAPGATTRKDHPGMGLTIAQNLCTQLGWSVSLKGDATSCTYTLTIPRRESDFTTP